MFVGCNPRELGQDDCDFPQADPSTKFTWRSCMDLQCLLWGQGLYPSDSTGCLRSFSWTLPYPKVWELVLVVATSYRNCIIEMVFKQRLKQRRANGNKSNTHPFKFSTVSILPAKLTLLIFGGETTNFLAQPWKLPRFCQWYTSQHPQDGEILGKRM